jgi:Rieske Fe-S protein
MMERKTFIRTCGVACISGTAFSSLLQSCTGTRIVSGTIEGSDLIIPLSRLEKDSGGRRSFRPYIIVQNDLLQYPLCVYRFSATDYTALWMACTHQGTELQVFGNKLQCPAHGSVFSNHGNVENGPADRPLRNFRVRTENSMLRISLT